jgi:DNA mismatch repair protein MutL
MGVIRILDETVANQIAAGEVVERPASVVKELVENALDAGATRIEVAIESGGADRLRVSDDGCGMERDDAGLALERHATSKIGGAADLKSIASFGFRGEALPAIASVSRLTLTTATGDGRGTRVVIHGGRRRDESPAPHPRGTTVEVEGLFYNAPARRKFLRAPGTETAHVADMLARLAAAHPAVAFRLQSGGRTLASWPEVASFRERVAQIVGAADAACLVPVDRREGSLRLVGLASSPALGRSTSRDEHLFVNGRPIRDRRLLHAVQAAYAAFLTRGRFPIVYLFLEVPLEEVDVNVHPAKLEVRFRHPGAVHDLVRDSLRAALEGSGASGRVTWGSLRAPAGAAPAPAIGGATGVGESTAGYGDIAPAGARDQGRSVHDRQQAEGAVDAPPLDAVAVAPLAQFRDTYILASSPDGLVIVDQHAAHERILYDRLVGQERSRGVERQRLLFPITIELRPSEQQALDAAHDSLEALGFGIAPFGAGAVIVDEVPALLGGAEPGRLVRELLAEILEWDRAEGVDQLRHRLLASAACHAAVTANERLGEGRMRQILDDLLRPGRPLTCPHGRPAILRLSVEQLEKEFRRR